MRSLLLPFMPTPDGVRAGGRMRTLVLAALAFAVAWGPTAGDLILVLLALWALPLVLAERELRTNAVVLAGVIWFVYLAAMVVRAGLIGVPGDPLHRAEDFLFPVLAPLVAIQVAAAAQGGIGYGRLAILLMAAGVAGVALRIVLAADWAAGLSAFGVFQDGIGELNRNVLAMYCGLMLIAGYSLIAWLAGGLGSPADQAGSPARAWAAAGLVAAVAAVVIAALALLAIESRTNWVAAVAATLAWGIAFIVSAFRRSRSGALRALLLLVPAVVVAAGLVVLFLPSIQDRFAERGGFFENASLVFDILTGRYSGTAEEIAGLDPRAQLYLLGTQLVALKPLFGWGPDASYLVGIFARDDFIRTVQRFHSAYLEFAIDFGAVGAGVLLAVFAVMLSRLGRTGDSWQPLGARFSAPVTAFGVAFLVYMLVLNATENALYIDQIAQAVIVVLAMLLARTSIWRAGADLREAALWRRLR